jgi:hypothetical protein
MRQGLCLSSRSFNDKESSSLSNCILIGSRTKTQMMMSQSFETRGKAGQNAVHLCLKIKAGLR